MKETPLHRDVDRKRLGETRHPRGVVNGEQRKPGWWRCVVALFGAAVLLNYGWEVAQSPLYTGMPGFPERLWHCFLASLGDGALVWLILAAGWVIFRRADWFARPGAAGYGVMLGSGLAIAIAVELLALGAGRWAYASSMPLLPGTRVGVVPVTQMLLLPPLVFRIAARLYARKSSMGPHAGQGHERNAVAP